MYSIYISKQNTYKYTIPMCGKNQYDCTAHAENNLAAFKRCQYRLCTGAKTLEIVVASFRNSW